MLKKKDEKKRKEFKQSEKGELFFPRFLLKQIKWKQANIFTKKKKKGKKGEKAKKK